MLNAITRSLPRCNFLRCIDESIQIILLYTLTFWWFIFSVAASSQNIQIQVFPQPVIYQENDLVIQCSITNPSQLSSVYYIQLLRNSSMDFETLVSILNVQTQQIQWPSVSTLRYRASVEGSEINTPRTTKLKLTVEKNSVLCPTDFTAYKCKFSGISTSTSDVVTQEANPVTITYIGKCRGNIDNW